MPQITELFLLDDLENPSRTSKLAYSDLHALQTVADWIKTFVARPNKDLGRRGPVCPFVPYALELKTLWLAPAQIGNARVPDVVQLIDSYGTLLLRAQAVDSDDAIYKAIVVVFTDVSAARVEEYGRDSRIQELKRRSYDEYGVVLGEFHEMNNASSIHNASFEPFKPPIPFLLLRPTVISDWMFFLDNEDWLSMWARRFGLSAVHALAEALRGTNWRQLEERPQAAKRSDVDMDYLASRAASASI